MRFSACLRVASTTPRSLARLQQLVGLDADYTVEHPGDEPVAGSRSVQTAWYLNRSGSGYLSDQLNSVLTVLGELSDGFQERVDEVGFEALWLCLIEPAHPGDAVELEAETLRGLARVGADMWLDVSVPDGLFPVAVDEGFCVTSAWSWSGGTPQAGSQMTRRRFEDLDDAVIDGCRALPRTIGSPVLQCVVYGCNERMNLTLSALAMSLLSERSAALRLSIE